MNKETYDYIKDISSTYRHNKAEIIALEKYNKKIANLLLDNKNELLKLNNLELFELLGNINLEELQELIDNE